MKTQGKLDWNAGALAEGLRCYERREFFEAHEHWESVWVKCKEPERSFVQAFIQMAVACHHFERSNLRGAGSMLKKALRKLEPYPALFETVEVTPLREELRAWLQRIEADQLAMSSAFPQIRLLPAPSEGRKAGVSGE
jgi:predicted metal-dependent hydrolase